MQTIMTIDQQFYFELGKQIRRLREMAQLTQLELAKKVGCSRTLIVAYENGYCKIKPYKWEKICEVLNILSGIEIDIKLDKKDVRHY